MRNSFRHCLTVCRWGRGIELKFCWPEAQLSGIEFQNKETELWHFGAGVLPRQQINGSNNSTTHCALYDKGVPALKNVVGLPFCDIGFAVQGEHLIIVATEDNLLKGAAAQAVQCANIRFGYAETQSLI